MYSTRVTPTTRAEALHLQPNHIPARACCLLPLALALLLTACGGGDGDTAPPPSLADFTLSGTLGGLAAGKRVMLQNNGSGDLTVMADGPFTFADRVPDGGAYAVTVKAQPEGQTCAVTQGNGVATANVTGIAVHCQYLPAARYSVGGTISGLAEGATLVLQNNGGDDLTVSANGGFTFPTPLTMGAAYAAAVKTQPAGQTCSVRNGSGTLGDANLSSVQVTCANSAAALPEGDWQMEMCSQDIRTLWRITLQGNTSAAMEQGLVQYGNAQCSGSGTVLVAPNSSLGSVVFDRSEATSTLTAFWGAWRTPSGITSRTIWARKGEYLCVLGDEMPSILPTAQAVESSANIQIASKGCYIKR